jgi:DNA transformation protein and related proteins
MAASAEFVSHLREQLAGIGPLGDGLFFGGHAFKLHGHQFAMVMGNTLYFRVSAATRDDYVSRGSPCFSYTTRKGRVQVRQYHAVPDEVLEDPELLRAWARKAAGL